MSRYQLLYKDNSSRLSEKKSRLLAIESRNNQRRNLHAMSRNIPETPFKSISSDPVSIEKNEQKTVTEPEEKENTPSLSTEARASSAMTKQESKTNRKEAFIKRFVAWKNKKQTELVEKKKPPFVVPGTSRGPLSGVKNSSYKNFPMKSQKFKPPEGLKNPILEKVGKSDFVLRTDSRRSIYTVVDTPPKQSKIEEKKKSLIKTSGGGLKSTMSSAFVNTKLEKQNHFQVPDSRRTNLVPGSSTQINKKVSTDAQATNSKKVPDGKQTLPPRRVQPLRKAVEASKKSKLAFTNAGAGSEINRRPIARNGPISKESASSSGNQVEKTMVKTRVPRIKITATDNPKTFSLKQPVKSPLSRKTNKHKPPSIKLNNKILTNVAQDGILSATETPAELVKTSNLFSTAVTSTTRKNSNSEDVRLSDEFNDTVSPVECLQPRDLIQPVSPKKIESVKKKFQFVRYTEVPMTPASVKKEDNQSKEQSFQQKTILPIGENNETPPKSFQNFENSSNNYMSPFVSVSRGKVNLKKEKDQRNSIYLPNMENIDDISATSVMTSKMQIELRRTLETVNYFHKQMNDEYKRLHLKCDKWELYKTQNSERLAESGGDDMINATIGQTKLLTSKKLKQFNELIEQCKNCADARSKGEILKDTGSESSKLILAKDLEGFWCVIAQQIENLDKRFDNLERWKSNDWIDPNENKIDIIKDKKNLTKVTKAKKTKKKVNASKALQDMLLNLKAAYKNNKNTATANSDHTSPLVILTPSKKGSQVTPRIAVIVQDRRSRSIAPTVITLNSSRRSIQKNSVDSPKQFNKPEDLRKSAMISAEMQKELIVQTKTPEKCSTYSRKSILKTPGTTSTTKTTKRLVFNEQPTIRKFNFVINDEVLENTDDDDFGKDI